MGNFSNIEPSLVFSLDFPIEDAKGNTVLQSVAIETKWYVPTKHTFTRLAKEIQHIAPILYRHYRKTEEKKGKEEPQKPQSLQDSSDSGIRFSIVELDDADYKFDYESLRLINEIRMRIKALRNKGVNTLFLNDIIDNGTSPLQYINKKKVERAQLLLCTTDMPVKEVAYRIGFNDQSYFIRMYRKVTGTTPQEYRKQQGLS